MRRTELRKKVLYALAVASVATFVHGGGVPTYATDMTNILVKGDEMSEDVVNGQYGYVYGITGGNVYVDSTTQDEDGNIVPGGLKGTVSGVNDIVGAFGQLAGLDQSIIDAVGTVNSVLDKTANAEANGDTVINGNTGLQLENYGKDWVRYYGAVGGDVSVNTGLQGNPTVLVKPTSDTTVVRKGDVANVVDSGSVIGGIGGSAAMALGNVQASATALSGLLKADITLNGKTATTINGSVKTKANPNANLIGFMNGGLAAGVGGTATSTVTGDTVLTIDGTDRADHAGGYEDPANDMIPQLATALNVMKGSKINAIGVAGGGTALTTLGGTAASNVNGTTTIDINNATVLGTIGGGIAGAVDATGVAEAIIAPNDQLGNDDGTSGFGIDNVQQTTDDGNLLFKDDTGKQYYKKDDKLYEVETGNEALGITVDTLDPVTALEIIRGKEEATAPIHVTIKNANEGGTAKATTGGTNIALTGNSTAVGIIGGGVAAASHTYTWKGDGTKEDGTYSVDDEYGKSVAEATTGKSHITIVLDNTGLDGDAKNAMLQDAANFKGKLMNALGMNEPGSLYQDEKGRTEFVDNELADLANKGAAIGVFGGGAAIAQSGNRQFLEQDGNADDTFKRQGAYATATTAGSQIDIQSGYVAGVMGGGIAGAMNNATAKAEMTDTVDINISGVVGKEGEKSTEVVGVFGNGLAYFTGSTTTNGNDGKTAYANLKGTATVSAVNTNVNVSGGSVDGIIGGGMAIDDSDAHRTNAIAETSGKATINVSGSAVVNTANLDALNGMVGNVPADGIDMASYVDGVKAAAGNAAIAAGGIALGGGAEAYVKESEVNIAGGTVDGNIYGGGIAAYGYDELTGDGETKGSRVDTATINLTGGEVNGNVYAGGAVATQTSDGAAVYVGYDKAAATVGTAVVNLAGTDVKGILYGAGTINQVADAASAQVWVGESTLNISGENTLSNVLADKTTASKIQAFDNVNVAANSVTKLDNSVKPGTEALIDGGTITVDSTARLDISALDKTGSLAYNIAANYNEGSTFWSDDNLIYDRMAAYATSSATAGGNGQDSQYTITYDSINESNWKDAADSMGKALNAGPVQPLVDQGMRLRWDTNQGISEGAREYFREWMYNPNLHAAFGRGMMIGEDSAVTGNTVSVARDVADEVSQHLSFTEDFVQDHDSIYGDDNIWAKYIHNKFETDGMSSSFGDITADNDYNGVIVGYDFNQSGKLQSGVAIHYGNGSGTGSFSRNDYDAWGVSLYGALKDEEAGTNLMADIGYTKTTNDISGTIAGKDLTADRDLTAWTIGVRGEKEFVSGRNQIVPYVGLRYMNVDPSSYTSYYNGKKAFEYDADKQDIWMVPLGVSFRNETKTGSGWRITPKLDVAYIWAFGDTDNSVDVNMAGASAPLYYTVMDDGSWLASLGIDASRGAWTFGAGYAYQKGDDTKNNKWYVNAGFAF